MAFRHGQAASQRRAHGRQDAAGTVSHTYLPRGIRHIRSAYPRHILSEPQLLLSRATAASTLDGGRPTSLTDDSVVTEWSIAAAATTGLGQRQRRQLLRERWLAPTNISCHARCRILKSWADASRGWRGALIGAKRSDGQTVAPGARPGADGSANGLPMETLTFAPIGTSRTVAVNGHRFLPSGGHEIPHWWPSFLPAGGRQISPPVAIVSPEGVPKSV